MPVKNLPASESSSSQVIDNKGDCERKLEVFPNYIRQKLFAIRINQVLYNNTNIGLDNNSEYIETLCL